MHTTAWDRLWEGDETLKCVSIYIAWLHFTQYCNIHSSVSPRLMDPRGLRMTQTANSSFLTHAKQLSLVALCDTTAGIGKKGNVTYIRKDRQTWSLKYLFRFMLLFIVSVKNWAQYYHEISKCQALFVCLKGCFPRGRKVSVLSLGILPHIWL